MPQIVVGNAADLVEACAKLHDSDQPGGIRMLPGEYELATSDLPLKLKSFQHFVGAGIDQTKLIHTTNSGSSVDIIQLIDPATTGAGAVFNARVSDLTIHGSTKTSKGIYAKGLRSSVLENLKIFNMTAGKAVHLEATNGFAVYYNLLRSVFAGFGASGGCLIGFDLDTSDFSQNGARVNSNLILNCTARYCSTAGMVIDGGVSNQIAQFAAENDTVGLRLLNCSDTVVTGGYFESNTATDIHIQIGDPGTLVPPNTDPNPCTRTCLLRPFLRDTSVRLDGKSRGATGDFYIINDNGGSPEITNYEANWIHKTFIANIAASWAQFVTYDEPTRVGYYGYPDDTQLRMEIWNTGEMRWGPGGTTSLDTKVYRSGVGTLAMGDDDSFRLNEDGKLQWAASEAGSVDVEMKRTGANELSMADGDDFKVEGTYNSGRLRIGAGYLWVDSNGDLYYNDTAPMNQTDGTKIASPPT